MRTLQETAILGTQVEAVCRQPTCPEQVGARPRPALVFTRYPKLQGGIEPMADDNPSVDDVMDDDDDDTGADDFADDGDDGEDDMEDDDDAADEAEG